jgi:hypothetical protein
VDVCEDPSEVCWKKLHWLRFHRGLVLSSHGDGVNEISNAVDENMDHGPEAANVPLTGKGLQRLRRLQKPMQEEEML